MYFKHSHLKDISINILKYQKVITLLDLTHIISMFDHVAINAETLKIDDRCSLKT